jgi:hypothetical protein
MFLLKKGGIIVNTNWQLTPYIKMKKIVLLFICLLPLTSSYAQDTLITNHVCLIPIDSTTSLPQYKIIRDVQGVSKNDLYSRYKIWVSTTFNSAPDVIKFDDPTNGTVHIKGLAKIYHDIKSMGQMYGFDWYCYFTLEAYFKEGRYKIEIKNFNYKDANHNDISFENTHHRWTQINFDQAGKNIKRNQLEAGFRMEERFNTYMQELLASIEIAMNSQIETKKDDW